jgi:hypothetical protein
MLTLQCRKPDGWKLTEDHNLRFRLGVSYEQRDKTHGRPDFHHRTDNPVRGLLPACIADRQEFRVHGERLESGFFFSMLPTAADTPGRAVYLIYAGAIILAACVITLGVGLLRA